MKFRSDIQGLRAVAVLLVIAHHYFPNLLPGGFFGVDIFFVISGYIITQILRRDLVKPLSLFLLDFYARRIRRILPTALLIIVVITLASHILLGPITGADTARDGIFASLFIANIHFNKLAIDYFASGLPQPILQHFWSLSIEEQFYLVWPLLFFVLARWKFGAKIVAVCITVGSFVFALNQISTDAATTYFSTFSRIWELGVGALLALSNVTRPNQKFSALGLISLIIYSSTLHSSQDFLGFPALLVIALTVLAVITSEGNRFLQSKVMVWIGDSSFVLYLIHWPILQIYRLYKGESVNLIESLILLVLCFLISALIHHSFENPIRYSIFLVKNSARTIVLGIGSIVLTILVVGYLGGGV